MIKLIVFAVGFFELLFSLNPAFADLQIETSESSQTVVVRMVGNVRLTQDLSVSGNWLCQDGKHIYFDSVASCEASNRSENNSFEHNCSGSLRIVPIREIEFIGIDSNQSQFLTRFYRVSTVYSEQSLTISREDFSRLDRIKTLSEIPYELSVVETKEIALCRDRVLFPPTNVLAEEREGSTLEKYVVQALLRARLPIVNSPYGRTASIAVDSPLRDIRHEGPLRFRTLDHFNDGDIRDFVLNDLSTDTLAEELFAPSFETFESEDSNTNLKSPFCNMTYSKDRIWLLAGGGGGHVGGGGFSSFRTDTLQEISKDLWLEPVVDTKRLNQYLRKAYDPSVRLFTTGCEGIEL